MKRKLFSNIAIILSISLSGCISVHGEKVNLPAVIAQSNAAKISWKEILPPPPKIDSLQHKWEMNEVISYQSPEYDERRKMALQDNDIDPFKTYSSILGPSFKAENYPKTKELINYSLTYSALHINGAKNVYSRKRPFQENSEIKICEDKPPNSSSYPSGHSASGWIVSNILARLFQEKSDDIYARGIDYGKSRVICGVHYPSDVAIGQIVGDIVMSKLQNDAQFIILFRNANDEIDKKGK